MGRHPKIVNSECGTERREIGYYATPDFVAKFLVQKLLEIRPDGQSAIDPCVGKGELVGELIRLGKRVTGIDIVDFGGDRDYGFLKQDFIDLYQKGCERRSSCESAIDFSQFDYWIANPPYNCHEVDYIQKNRQSLKQSFHDVGIHNMYSMFVSAMIDLAAENAVIGIITLDSFLTSRFHAGLRRKILEKTRIHYLLLCPIDLFWKQRSDVRTCILILQKGRQKNHQLKHLIRVGNRPRSTAEFQKILSQEKFTLEQEENLFLCNPDKDNLEFILEVPAEMRRLFVNLPRLADKFTCVTGISTGNDRQYLSLVEKPGFSVPFYKNPGARKFLTQPDGYLCDRFLEISKQVKTFNVRNVHLLYKPGITCSSMGVQFSACYLPPNSTYGVNANIICDEENLWWLLAYLNSRLVTYLVRGVLIRTNMLTSGYVGRIPVPEFDQVRRSQLAELAKTAYQKLKQNSGEAIEQEIQGITNLCFDYLEISPSTRKLIDDFSADLVRRT
ncbi:N-6 DNA methylase [Leptolyngbya ohadii]|uniref:N-6 DNA methylase n=1 Tax=Leptolyngbya ohadii TaxID=1962290 RepID=UPI000B599C00|nr:N-6 DNA methylase [Leptolyngbya ohadii]